MSDANNLTFPVPSKVTVEKIGGTVVTTGRVPGTWTNMTGTDAGQPSSPPAPAVTGQGDAHS
jgi:hypothetical protein